jgi:Predicted transcriptional regulator
MVSSKEQIKATFAEWFNSALDASGVPAGRGRAGAVARRYRVSIPAARKWLDGVGLPDMAQLGVIVSDLGGAGAAAASASPVGPTQHYLRQAPSNSPWSVQESVPVSQGATRPDHIRIPLLVMESGMGGSLEVNDQPEVIEHLDIARWWAEMHLPRPLDRIRIITSRGDSNAPLINDGDVVFVDTACTSFDGEGLYVFNWNGRALIKRLAPNLRSNGLRIISANPAYPAEEISVDEVEHLHIAGRVVAWFTLRRS